jgi:hypothetical protein
MRPMRAPKSYQCKPRCRNLVVTARTARSETIIIIVKNAMIFRYADAYLGAVYSIVASTGS